ncbi:MAG: AAA family ATPase [Saprospiraceae bacterium]
MAKETLTVKNFGPIREAHLDLQKVTVLIGEQASGKSVLAKLVAIFSDILLEARPLKNVAWEFYNLENFISNESKVEFKGEHFQQTFEGEIHKEMCAEDLAKYFEQYEKKREQWENDLFDSQIKSNRTAEERNRSRANREEMSIQRKYLSNIGGIPKYIPAERPLVSVLAKSIFQLIDNDIKIPRFLTDFAAEFEIAREGKPEFKIPFLRTSYSFKGGKDKVLLSKNQEIELSESATGFQTAIPMALVIEHLQEKGKYLFIIEEPELNLYPSTQKRLVEYIVEKCTKGDNRLIITTHSPYILTALNNCIEASNALKANPDAKAEVDALVPPASQIDFADVSAYFVADGTARSIMNEEYQIIDANALDDISDELSQVHNSLTDIKYQL